MILKKEIIIHIGLPKTGTTSLQHILQSNRSILRNQDTDFYLGLDAWKPQCHRELQWAVLRDDTETFVTLRQGRPPLNYHQNLKTFIQAFINISQSSKIIFSYEGLSLLRTREECLALKELFGINHSYKIILVLRDKEEFLKSYKSQILEDQDRKFSNDFKSSLYVDADTWITDYDAIIDCFQDVFENITIINYDPNGVENVLSAMGVSIPENNRHIFLNKTKFHKHRTRRAGGSILRRIFRRIRNTCKNFYVQNFLGFY